MAIYSEKQRRWWFWIINKSENLGIDINVLIAMSVWKKYTPREFIGPKEIWGMEQLNTLASEKTFSYSPTGFLKEYAKILYYSDIMGALMAINSPATSSKNKKKYEKKIIDYLGEEEGMKMIINSRNKYLMNKRFKSRLIYI